MDIVNNLFSASKSDSLYQTLIRPNDPWYKGMLIGYSTGCMYVIAGHPLESIKTKLQTGGSIPINSSSKISWNHSYSSFNLFRNSLFNQLYQGFIPALITIPIGWSINFYFFQFYLNYLRDSKWYNKYIFDKLNRFLINNNYNNNNTYDRENSLITVWFAGLLASTSWAGIITPIDLIKGYCQKFNVNSLIAIKKFQQFNKEYTNHFINTKYSHLIQPTIEKNLYNKIEYIFIKQYCMLCTIFRGYNATFARIIPECTIYYGMLETSRKYIPHYNNNDSSNCNYYYWKLFFAGSVTTFIAWIFALPGDTIKTQIQTNINDRYSNDGNSFNYNNNYQTGFYKNFQYFVNKNGYFALWRGLSAMMIRAPLLGGTGFVCIEIVNKWMNQKLDNE